MEKEEKEKIGKIIQSYNDDALAEEIKRGSDKYSPEGLEMLKNELKKRVSGLRTLSKYQDLKEGGVQKMELGTNVAKLGKRVSAYIFDFVLFAIPWLIIFFVFLGHSIRIGTSANAIDLLSRFQSTSIFIAPLLFIYAGILVGRYGWTLGKRYASIAVVRADSFEKISFPRAFLREGVKVGLNSVPYIGFLVLLVNIFLILYSPRRQAAHDIIAGTQVINIPTDKKKKKILTWVGVILFILFFASLFYTSVYAPKKAESEFSPCTERVNEEARRKFIEVCKSDERITSGDVEKCEKLNTFDTLIFMQYRREQFPAFEKILQEWEKDREKCFEK